MTSLSTLKIFVLLSLSLNLLYLYTSAPVDPKAHLEYTLLTEGSDSSNSSQEITVGLHNTVTIKANGNATTGYSWYVWHHEDSTITTLNLNKHLTTHDYKENSKTDKIIGVGGVWSFKFSFLKVGNSVVNFVYKRSWEEETVKKVNFTFKVMKNPPEKNQKIRVIVEDDEPQIGNSNNNVSIGSNGSTTADGMIQMLDENKTSRSLNIRTIGMFLLLALVVFTI